MANLLDPLTLAHGPAMKNRLALAPLTNLQSHPDGRMSEDEFNWLTYRAKGGFALTMTCAAHVQRIGQGFPGQMGIFGDVEGLFDRLCGFIGCLRGRRKNKSQRTQKRKTLRQVFHFAPF